MSALKQSERNILGQIRRRGYSICGRSNGQSMLVGERLVKRGLATGIVYSGALYLYLTDAGRSALSSP